MGLRPLRKSVFLKDLVFKGGAKSLGLVDGIFGAHLDVGGLTAVSAAMVLAGGDGTAYAVEVVVLFIFILHGDHSS